MSDKERDQVQLIIGVTKHLYKTGDLAMWTVYDHPLDYPEHFVARCFRVRGGENPTDHVITAASLHQLRIMLMAAGLTCLNRNKGDDAKIVETWL